MISTVIIAEDFEPFRRVLYSVLQGSPTAQVICEVADGLEAVEKTAELRPDITLLDIGLPRLNGIEAARRIKHVSPRSKIIFVSQQFSSEIVEEAMATGARGFVVKLDVGRELLTAIEAVLRGDKFLSSTTASPE